MLTTHFANCLAEKINEKELFKKYYTNVSIIFFNKHSHHLEEILFLTCHKIELTYCSSCNRINSSSHTMSGVVKLDLPSQTEENFDAAPKIE